MAVSKGQTRYLGAQIAAALLENAAMVEHEDALRRATRRWLPDSTTVDEMDLREIVKGVRAELMGSRAALLTRCDGWVANGKAEAL